MGFDAGHALALACGGEDGADAFGDDEAILGGAALSADGATYFLGDTSVFGNNRVAVVSVGAAALIPLAVLDVADPQAIATSPFGDVALVSSARDGDRLVILDKAGAAGPWRVRGNVATVGGNPMLPGDHAAVMRGSLAGHVWVAEVTSIRHLAFRASGAVEEVDAFAFGGGVENINGAIGVTP